MYTDGRVLVDLWTGVQIYIRAYVCADVDAQNVDAQADYFMSTVRHSLFVIDALSHDRRSCPSSSHTGRGSSR